MIDVGQKVRFDPFANLEGPGSRDNKGKMVTGTVAFVNAQDGWFSVVYIANGVNLRTSFWPLDVDEGTVILCV